MQVFIECTCGQLYGFIQGSPIEIQIASHWYLITCSMTALPPVLLTSSNIPLFSSYVVIPAGKNWACLKNVIISVFIIFLKQCLKFVT
jgi:hypothetical protein